MWRASLPIVVGVLGLGLVAFSFLLPSQAMDQATPAPEVTDTVAADLEVTKAAPPSALPEPPQPTPGGPGGIDCGQVACVALTFDDGPSANSDALLDKLAELGVRATFFNTGRNTELRPDQVARQVADGHALGGHSWNHADMRKRSAAEACADADRTAAAIKAASGVDTILVRPPYGSWNDSVLAACTGKAFILWNVDTEDWSSHDPAKIADHAINDAKPGSIILMHDTVAETAQALPEIVAGLKAKGYELVTIPELFNEPIGPGQAIYSGLHP
ncbi:MAG: polysaccharide deacetylase family protein [Bifidobacteriaceae bacterium]|jgi:peptidoglycan/xylan/chitin deacetylase (PgdA/CDA1 family)|nr:polysaccharide deacetylase family protein [Bifidobacteriaceae bacterium]